MMDRDEPQGMFFCIECSVCLEIYNTTDKKPKTLPCGHTFCQLCLVTLSKENTLKCPTDRSKCSLPEQGISGLPTNFSLIDVVDSSCQKCRTKSYYVCCDHCSQKLCNECMDKHRKELEQRETIEIEAMRKKVLGIQDEFHKDAQVPKLYNRGDNAIADTRTIYQQCTRRLEQWKDEMMNRIRTQVQSEATTYHSWRDQFGTVVLGTLDQLDRSLSTLKSNQRNENAYGGQDASSMRKQCERKIKELESSEQKKPVLSSYQLDTALNEFDAFLTQLDSLSISNTAAAKTTSDPKNVYDEEQYLVPLCSSQAEAAYSDLGVPSQNINHSHPCDRARFKRMIGKLGSDVGQFNFPLGIAATTSEPSRIVVADQNNNRIYILDKNLEAVSVFGTKGAQDGQFNLPTGVAINNQNKIFITDQMNHRVQVADFSGKIQYKFGHHGSNNTGFNCPLGIAVDHKNQLYIADAKNFRVKVTTEDGIYIRSFGEKGNKAGKFRSTPFHIAVSQKRTIAVSDVDGNLYIFANSGRHLETIMGGETDKFKKARGLAYDQWDNLILGDKAGRIVVMSENQDVICTIGDPGNGAGQLKGTQGVAVTSSGNVVVCDKDNARIQLFEV